LKVTPKIARSGLAVPDVAFDQFVSSLRPSLKLWDYFVNWDKVFRNTREIEIHLNLWNFLLGKENFDDECRRLLFEHPQIVQALPSMVVRDGAGSQSFAVVKDLHDIKAAESKFDFSKSADSEGAVEAALEFIHSTGLVKLFAKDGVKNLVDYVLGVEAGVDSNARKNRSGSAMEAVVGGYLEGFANKYNVSFISQATPAEILSRWGFEVPVDKSSRRFDFAISDGKKLVLMEVNFYGGGGSKLKATAGEYKGLGEFLNVPNLAFVWVTDGQGWQTTLRPLREAFDKLDYIWNLSWLAEDYLADLFEV